ncbi:MAG: Mobile element protein [Pseudonocardia sp.]|nr:Mobile element protein [Pseudonocardia sp.]
MPVGRRRLRSRRVTEQIHVQATGPLVVGRTHRPTDNSRGPVAPAVSHRRGRGVRSRPSRRVDPVPARRTRRRRRGPRPAPSSAGSARCRRGQVSISCSPSPSSRSWAMPGSGRSSVPGGPGWWRVRRRRRCVICGDASAGTVEGVVRDRRRPGRAAPHTPGMCFAGLRTVAFDGLNSLKVPDSDRNRRLAGPHPLPHRVGRLPEPVAAVSGRDRHPRPARGDHRRRGRRARIP